MRTLVTLIVSAGFLLAGTACSKDTKQSDNPAVIELSAGQKAHLVQLYEEEKLAHDLYTEFYAEHNYKPFSHHSEAEAKHMGFVADILSKYELPIPQNVAGVFNNAEYQKAYNEWLPKGLADGKDALYIAAYIEEMDILDLMNAIDNIAEADDIKALYEELLMGSENHLRAYNKFIGLELGLTYQPQIMDQALFDAIMAGGSGSHGGGK